MQNITPSSFKAIKETINRNFQDTAYILFYRRISRSHPAYPHMPTAAGAAGFSSLSVHGVAARTPQRQAHWGQPVTSPATPGVNRSGAGLPMAIPHRGHSIRTSSTDSTGSNASGSGSALAIGTPPMRSGGFALAMPPPSLHALAASGSAAAAAGTGFSSAVLHKRTTSIAESARFGHTLASLELAAEGPQSVIDDNTRYLIHDYCGAFSDVFYWHVQQEVSRLHAGKSRIVRNRFSFTVTSCLFTLYSPPVCTISAGNPLVPPVHRQMVLSSVHSSHHPARQAVMTDLLARAGPGPHHHHGHFIPWDSQKVALEVYAGLGLDLFQDPESQALDGSVTYPPYGRRQLRYIYNIAGTLASGQILSPHITKCCLLHSLCPVVL